MLSPVRVLVVEDDRVFADSAVKVVEKIGSEVIKIVDNSAEALEAAFTLSPDLILMDIHIKGSLNGIEVAEKLQHLQIPTLFVTAYKDKTHFEMARRMHILGFLIKPLDPYTLQSAVEMALKALGQLNKAEKQKGFVLKDSLFLRKNRMLQKVFIRDIQLIHSEGNYSILLTSQGKFVIKESLGNIQEKLNSKNFVRVHKSYLIAINKIQTIDLSANQLTINGNIVSVGRKYKEGLMNLLNFM